MENKKNSAGLIVLVVILSLVIVGLAGYVLYDKKIILNQKEKVREENEIYNLQTSISVEQEKFMQKIVDLMLMEGEDYSNFEKLDDSNKISVLSHLTETSVFDGLSGKELQNVAKKYFDYSEKLNFVPLKCSHDHDYYIYDSNKDIYIENPEHSGHGGGTGEHIGSRNFKYSIERKDNDYKYVVSKMYIDGEPGTDTGCGVISGKVYATLDDAKNTSNVLLDGFVDSEYCYNNMGTGCMICNFETINDVVKDKLTKYEFNFKEKNGNLVFVNYSIIK